MRDYFYTNIDDPAVVSEKASNLNWYLFMIAHYYRIPIYVMVFLIVSIHLHNNQILNVETTY